MLISGYYGFGNAGDEAVLAGILQQLSSLWPEACFVVISGDPQRTYLEHGVRAVERRDLKGVHRALRASTLFVSGGGTLLQDVTSSRSLYYYLFMIMAARWYGLPVIIYGQGIGPLQVPWNRLLTVGVLRVAQLIMVRDAAAYEQLLAWGLDKGKLCLGADPVLALQSSGTVFPDAGLLTELEEDGAVLAVSLRPWPSLSSTLPAIAAALDKLCQKGWRVVFVPLQFEGDYSVCQACAELMQEPALVWPKRLGAREALALFGRVDYCLGMRLHSLIFAAVQGTPMLGLAYDPKVEQFMAELGLEDLTIALPRASGDSLNPERVTSGLRLLSEERERLAAHLGERVEAMAARLRAANDQIGGQLGMG